MFYTQTYTQFDIIEEHDWATRFVFFLVMAIGTAASHAVLAQWSLFKHLTDFGVVRATAGFDAVGSCAIVMRFVSKQYLLRTRSKIPKDGQQTISERAMPDACKCTLM